MFLLLLLSSRCLWSVVEKEGNSVECDDNWSRYHKILSIMRNNDNKFYMNNLDFIDNIDLY